MIVVIYQSLIILIFVMFYGICSAHVFISGNVTDFLGSNNTKLECSFDVRVFLLQIFAKNETGDILNIISISVGEEATFPSGEYLKTRVDVTKITFSSRNAIVTFNELRCEDDLEYACKINFVNGGTVVHQESNYSSISVRAPPSKPSSISLVKTPDDSIISSTKYVEYSNSSPSTTVTSTSTSTESGSLKTTIQKDTTAFNYTTVSLPDYGNTSSTPSDADFSTNTSYRTTTYSTQQATKAQDIAAGDNITIICTGNVGKPPAKHVFKKYLKGQIVPMQNTISTTSISELSENCSYYRTSNLTFQVTAADNSVVIRCVVNSSMAGTDMFIETKPIEVFYEVSMPTITKYPNKTNYVVDEDTSINLTCKSDGNPKPCYQWYNENNELINTSANWTITDINVTNSGEYTCNVSNTFNGDTHTNAKHVQINIMNKAYTTRITLEHSSTLDDVPTTQSSTACSSSCVGKKEENSKENFDDIPTTQSSSTCSSSCVDKKEEKSKGNLVLVVVIVLSVVVVIVFPIIIIAWRKNARKSTTDTNESKGFVEPKSKLIAVSRTGDYDDIALEEDTNKTQTVKNVPEVEDNKKHNEEYFKRQEEEEQEMKKSNTPPEPAVYAEVNEATKSKNKLKTESTENADTQEEDTYAESQEGIYDRAGNRRHIENKNAEQFNSSSNSSKQNGNDDTKLSIQNSQLGSYANQGLEKDDIRKVATVSPTVRSSSGSQNDEQKISNRNNQSKQGYENIIGTEQTGISGEDSSHRTAL